MIVATSSIANAIPMPTAVVDFTATDSLRSV
jgi:hypothetical protein